MFTGIIECTGTIETVVSDKGNKVFTVRSPISNDLYVDQSVAHQGVCLTVVAVSEGSHQVVAVSETLQCTTADAWKSGDLLNLERCVQAGARLDGHIVQGHVDHVGKCVSFEEVGGSWQFTCQYAPSDKYRLVEKGSVAVNGVSLTCFDVTEEQFSVAIIPHTFQHTQFRQLAAGDSVNLEFDVRGKYVAKLIGPYLPSSGQ